MVESYRLALSLDPGDPDSQSGLATDRLCFFARTMSGLKADSSSDAADREAKELRPVILEIEGLAMSRPFVADRFLKSWLGFTRY